MTPFANDPKFMNDIKNIKSKSVLKIIDEKLVSENDQRRIHTKSIVFKIKNSAFLLLTSK